MPEEISARYPGVDQELLLECRILDLAMVAAWRWDLGDQFPTDNEQVENSSARYAGVHCGRRSTSSCAS